MFDLSEFIYVDQYKDRTFLIGSIYLAVCTGQKGRKVYYLLDSDKLIKDKRFTTCLIYLYLHRVDR